MNRKVDQLSANYGGFSLVNGGLFYSLTSIFRGKEGSKQGLVRTAMAMAMLTWVPICIMALMEGTLEDTDSSISFPEDFLFHVRFLLVVPFLILIEKVVDRSFIGYVKNTDDLIPNSQQDSFNRLVRRLDKLTNSYIPEILLLIAMAIYIILFWGDLIALSSIRNYFEADDGQLTIACWYYLLVCIPVFQLLVFRWFWRWVVWVYSLIRISRFQLQIDPLHADNMAGLAYLNKCPLTFSFILMAPSAILSANIGINIIYEGNVLLNYSFYILIYVVFLPIILYSPLLIFIAKLIEAKFYGVIKFGNLIRKHNLDYASKWIDDKTENVNQILGSVDNSSLSDINGSYAPVQNLKLFPLDYNMIIESFILNVIPYLPLVFTYYSASELFKTLIKDVIGG